MDVWTGSEGRISTSGQWAHGTARDAIRGKTGVDDGEQTERLETRLNEAIECIERLEGTISALQDKLLEGDWRRRNGERR